MVACFAVLTAAHQPRIPTRASILAYKLSTQRDYSASSISPRVFSGETSGATSGLAESIGANKAATELRSNIPRWGFPANFDATDMNYWIGVGINFGYGIVLAILTIFTLLFFCCCRFGCNKCGGKDPQEGGYSAKERWGVFVILALFACCSAAFSAVGFVGNDGLTSSIAGTNGINNTMLGVFDDIAGFIVSVRDLLNQISSQVSSIIGQILKLLSGTDVLNTGTAGLITRLNTLSSNLNGYSIVVGSTKYNCSFCTTVAGQVSTMSNEIDTKTRQPLADMKSTISSVDDSLIKLNSSIVSQTADTAKTLNTARSTVVDNRKSADDGTKSVKDADALRNLIVLILLCLPGFSFLMLIVGGISKKSCPFTCNYLVAYFVCFIMFLLFAIHLPLAVVLSDVCAYVNVKETNVTSLVSGDAGKFLSACYYNTSLITTYGLEQQLNFSSAIKFPVIPNLNDSFTFSSLQNFTSQVNALTVATYGFNSSTVDVCLKQINDITSTKAVTYGRTNLSSLNPTNPPYTSSEVTTLNNLKSPCQTLISTETALQNSINEIKANVSSINTYADVFKANISTVYSNLNSMSALLNPLFGTANQFRAIAYCGFLRTRYDSLKKNICETITGSFAMLALSMFVIGMCNIAVVVCSTILAKRMPAASDDGHSAAYEPKVIEIGNIPSAGGSLPKPSAPVISGFSVSIPQQSASNHSAVVIRR